MKRNLVLAVVKEYVGQNPAIGIDELKNAFPKGLQGSLGVIEEENTAKHARPQDYKTRYYTESNTIIRLARLR